MDDKRKFRRFQTSLPSELTREDPATPSLPVTIVDASFGGLGLIASDDIPAGTLITLTWTRPPFAPGTKAIFKGRVVSSRRKTTQAGKFAISLAYLEHDDALVQQLLHWAQTQALIQAKARIRTNGLGKARGNSF